MVVLDPADFLGGDKPSLLDAVLVAGHGVDSDNMRQSASALRDFYFGGSKNAEKVVGSFWRLQKRD